MKEIESNIWDTLKGVGVLLIFLVHNYNLGNFSFITTEWIKSLLAHGMLGVEITFICNSYFFAHKFDTRVRGGSMTGIHYVLRMIIRTLPLYYVAFGICLYIHISHVGGWRWGMLSFI